MRRRRRNSGGFDTNLDSLQDTITNVIGFLVLVLAVVGVNIGDAPIGDIPSQAELERQSRDLRAKAEELRARLLGLLDDTSQRKADIAALEAGRPDTGELDRRMSELLAALERTRSEIGAGTAREVSLKDQVRDLEQEAAARPAKPTEEIPDIRVEERYAAGTSQARPDWMDMEVLDFVCRQGMVSPALKDTLVDSAFSNAFRRATGKTLDQANDLETWQKAETYFSRNTVGAAGIHIHVYLAQESGGIRPGLQYDFADPFLGERVADLQGQGSEVQRLLGRVYSPSKCWVRFRVWDDSFEVYREARRVASALGYRVGWLPYDQEEQLRFGSGTGSGDGDGPN
jgi:hypothetical protein